MRALRQIRAIVRAHEAEFGAGSVRREVVAMLLCAPTLAVWALFLVVVADVLGRAS